MHQRACGCCWCLLVASWFGAIVAIPMLFIGLDHNPQGEFCENGPGCLTDFDMSHATLLLLSWFIPAFAVILVLSGLFGLIEWWSGRIAKRGEDG